MSHKALYSLLLDETEEVVLLFPTLLFGQESGKPLELHGAWIAEGVDGVADAIDESCVVVGFLSEHSVEISVELIDVSPVLDSLLEVMEHVDTLDVGTTMERSLERSYAGGYGRVGVGARR